MGFLDKAKDLLGQHDDKVDQAINKAGDAATEKFGHGDQVDKATEFARERTGEGDTTQHQPPPGAPGEGDVPPPPAGEAPPPPPPHGEQPPPPQQ